MLSYLRAWLEGTSTPRILVTASTFSPELSWSGAGPAFSISLEVSVEAESPITVLPDHTFLETRKMALYKQGFTFTDVETGEVVRRCDVSDCRNWPGFYVTADETVEIPKQTDSQRFVVTHTFMPPSRDGRDAGARCGLEVGHVYEIGLGERSSKVRWWKWGSKKEVFSFPCYNKRDREMSEGAPALQMVLGNQLRIPVVE